MEPEIVQLSSKEAESRERMSAYILQNSDLPSGLVETMLNQNKTGFDTRPIDFLESESVRKEMKTLDLADSMVLVHLTDYSPIDGVVLPRSESRNDIPGKHRSTIHSSLGYPVFSHGAGDWTEKKHVVLFSLRSHLDQTVSYKMDDVIIAGSVDISDGFVDKEISEEEKNEAVTKMIENGVIDQHTFENLVGNFKNGYSPSLARKMVNVDWDIDLDMLRKNIPDDHPLFETLSSVSSLRVSSFVNSPTHFIAISEIIKMGKAPLFVGYDKTKVAPVDLLVNKSAPSVMNSTQDKYAPIDSEMKLLINGQLGFKDHTQTPWFALEKIYNVSIRGVDGISSTNKLLDVFSGISSKKERLEMAISMISMGGKLHTEFLKEYVLRPKLLKFSLQKLQILKEDLQRELQP